MSYYQARAHGLAAADVKPKQESTKRKRARHPAGSEKGGEFVGDDPTTPENEAFETEG